MAKKKFPKGTEAVHHYVLSHAKIMSDGTIYVVTPNGNWMHKAKFIQKYA